MKVSKILIEINTDNAAFDMPNEVSDILYRLHNATAEGSWRHIDTHPCVDSNGNRVGELRVVRDEPAA